MGVAMKRTVFALLLWAIALVGVASAEVSMPEGLKNIPLPSGAKVVTAVNQSNTQMAALEASGDTKKIKEFYKEKLQKDGWKVEMEMEQNDMAILSFGKDQEKLVIAANKKGDQVAFTVTLSKE